MAKSWSVVVISHPHDLDSTAHSRRYTGKPIPIISRMYLVGSHVEWGGKGAAAAASWVDLRLDSLLSSTHPVTCVSPLRLPGSLLSLFSA